MIAVLYRNKTKLGLIELDATLSASHQVQVEVTENPVERGAAVSDHMRRKPYVFTCEGLVTNTPVSAEKRTALSRLSEGVAGPAENARNQLRALAGSGELITLITGLGITYSNMALTDLQMPEDRGITDAIRFTATFREVVIVQSQTVQLVTADPKSVRKLDIGTKPPKPAPPAVTQKANQSIADRLIFGRAR